jgi:hypothetical protein
VFNAASPRDAPKISTNSITMITGSKSARNVIFIPRNMSTGDNATHSSIAPYKLATLAERTIRNLGRRTFVMKEGLPTIELRLEEVPTEKNLQTSSARSSQLGKF